jgi:membrane protein
MRRLSAALRPTFQYWMKTEVHVYAFSVAANVLLSFFPFLIVMMSLSRLVFNEYTTIASVDLAMKDFFPDALGTFLHNNLPQRGPTQVMSLVLLLFTANGIFEPLEVGLNHVWGIRQNRSFVRNQMVSLALIFACGSLAISSLMLTAMNRQSLRGIFGITGAWISVAFFKFLSLLVVVLVLFLIYRFLPNGRPPLNRVIAAAIMVGILIEGLKYLSKLVWPWVFKKLAREYGVFKYSVTLVFLGFLASLLVLAGAEWAARNHRMDETAVETEQESLNA